MAKPKITSVRPKGPAPKSDSDKVAAQVDKTVDLFCSYVQVVVQELLKLENPTLVQREYHRYEIGRSIRPDRTSQVKILTAFGAFAVRSPDLAFFFLEEFFAFALKNRFLAVGDGPPRPRGRPKGTATQKPKVLVEPKKQRTDAFRRSVLALVEGMKRAGERDAKGNVIRTNTQAIEVIRRKMREADARNRRRGHPPILPLATKTWANLLALARQSSRKSKK